MPDPQVPYIVFGVITDIDSNLVTSTRVTAHDTTSGERIGISTNSLGQFVLDLANLASGYTLGNSITVYVRQNGYAGETTFTLSGEGGVQKNITTSYRVTL